MNNHIRERKLGTRKKHDILAMVRKFNEKSQEFPWHLLKKQQSCFIIKKAHQI